MRRLTNIHDILREVLEPNSINEKKEEKPDADKEKKDTAKPDVGKLSNSNVISTKGAFGSGGRPQKFISNLKSRARTPSTAPGLLKDLNIKNKPTGEDLDIVLNVLNQGIHGNELLSRAYLGAVITDSASDITGEKLSKKVVEVTVSELSLIHI